MNFFYETSFFCAAYRNQEGSDIADLFMENRRSPLPVSSLVLFEFRQSVRIQTWLHLQGRSRGYSTREGEAMLRDLQADLRSGILHVIPVDWAEVHAQAETLSAKHTAHAGHRFADILHVATALHLGAEAFLTFDRKQKDLAEAEGMAVPTFA